MGFFFRHSEIKLSHTRRRLILALTWVFAIIFGMFMCQRNADFMISLLDDASLVGMTFLGSFSVTLFPFVLSHLLINRLGFRFLPVLCFGSGFFQGFFGWGTMIAFPGYGWLVRPLLLFGSFLLTPMLWFYWVYSPGRGSGYCFPVSLLAASMVSWFNFSFISPFLAKILSL